MRAALMGDFEEYQATGEADPEICCRCEKEFPLELMERELCPKCIKAQEDAYDGPSDDDLSDFYGGGGTRPMSEQYREAAEQRRKLRADDRTHDEDTYTPNGEEK